MDASKLIYQTLISQNVYYHTLPKNWHVATKLINQLTLVGHSIQKLIIDIISQDLKFDR